MLQEPSPKPQPQHWIKFLGPWMQDFYPVSGWGFGTRIGRTQLFPTPLLDKNRFPNTSSQVPPVTYNQQERVCSTYAGCKAERASGVKIGITYFRGRPGKPNQRRADSQAGSRSWGVFVNSECFAWKNKANSQKSVPFASLRGFCEFSL